MIAGQYWESKTNKNIIKILQFLGNDIWACRSLLDGSDDDFFGNYIYNNFNKIEDLKRIENLERNYNKNMKNYNKITTNKRRTK